MHVRSPGNEMNVRSPWDRDTDEMHVRSRSIMLICYFCIVVIQFFEHVTFRSVE